MRTKLLLQFGLLLTVLLITTSDGSFFEYPKKILSDLIHSLKEKKKVHVNEIQHYHVHYYPVPIYEPPTKAPKKYELDSIYNELLTTLGWYSKEYKYVPEPKIKIPPHLFSSWKESIPWEYKTSGISFGDTVDHELTDDISVQVPFNQKIVIEHSDYDEKLKRSLL